MKRYLHGRLLGLVLLLSLAVLNIGCQASVGVGVGFAHPGPWGGPWHGPWGGPWGGGVYVGGPIYP